MSEAAFTDSATATSSPVLIESSTSYCISSDLYCGLLHTGTGAMPAVARATAHTLHAHGARCSSCCCCCRVLVATAVSVPAPSADPLLPRPLFCSGSFPARRLRQVCLGHSKCVNHRQRCRRCWDHSRLLRHCIGLAARASQDPWPAPPAKNAPLF